MSPIHDPRFSKVQRDRALHEEHAASERATRLEYIKPAVLLAVCGPLAMALFVRPALSDPDISAAGAALLYMGGFCISAIGGIIALVIASKLLIGGAGPLGLAVLRTAAAFGAHDVAYQLLGGGAGFYIYPLLFSLAVFVGVVAWLFDMDITESALVAIIMLFLKIACWAALLFLVR